MIMGNDLSCRVLVPVYRPRVIGDEAVSLASIRRHLGARGLCFVAPETLDLAGVLRDGESVERFPDHYFEGIDGYNRLLKSALFYSRFGAFTHILICQLDCLIFRDDLETWMAKGYDYLAPPWFEMFEHGDCKKLWRVGNGGLSLRRVESYLRLLNQRVAKGSIYPWFGNSYWKEAYPGRKGGLYGKISSIHRLNPWACMVTVEQELASYRYNEDVFWAIEAPKFDREFRVPPPLEALPFAFEVAPRWCFEKNGKELPFGCHAWGRYDREFWNDVLAARALSRETN
jgi:hypothetical protein